MDLPQRTSPCISLPQPMVALFKEQLPALAESGITYFAHGVQRKGLRTCFFSHDSWADLFLSQQKYKKDPLTRMAETTSLPYFMWEDINMDPEEQKIVQARQETCNIVKGMTFSNHCYDFHEIIAIGTTSRFLDFNALALNETLKTYLSQLIHLIRYQHLKYRCQG